MNAMNCSETTCHKFFVHNDERSADQGQCCNLDWVAILVVSSLGFMLLSTAIYLCVTHHHKPRGNDSNRVMPRVSMQDLDASISRGQPPNTPGLSRQTSFY